MGNRGTNKEQKITITTGSTLTTEEIDRMVNEAKKHTEQDKKNREIIEERNKLEGLIYAVKKTLNENRTKISKKEISNIEASISTAESKLQDKNIEVLKSTYADLTKVSHSFTDLLYKESKNTENPSNNSPDSATNNNSEDDNNTSNQQN